MIKYLLAISLPPLSNLRLVNVEHGEVPQVKLNTTKII